MPARKVLIFRNPHRPNTLNVADETRSTVEAIEPHPQLHALPPGKPYINVRYDLHMIQLTPTKRCLLGVRHGDSLSSMLHMLSVHEGLQEFALSIAWDAPGQTT